MGMMPGQRRPLGRSPTVARLRTVPPTAAEMQRLIEAAEKRNPTLAALVMLAALIGARWAELCALRWSDVDPATGTLRIARWMLDVPGASR